MSCASASLCFSCTRTAAQYSLTLLSPFLDELFGCILASLGCLSRAFFSRLVILHRLDGCLQKR
eukprot:m.125028 g.125028  ORF g.125028 m.125028 type:complete len:64 (+) comp13793_c0_seq1:178-369(+)